MNKKPREDAVEYRGRYIVPTVYGTGDPERDTIWVDSWEQFRAVGGQMCFSEDQTEIELTLPVRHKFSIQFMRQAAPTAERDPIDTPDRESWAEAQGELPDRPRHTVID